ncbi:diaminopimelate decarboxylase family protein [Marinobacterium jannaschii]|uniref:diaminopimelate decarboxylase family protein n=1 Tax=Marinobacterium jannaschii TaxID=64970 RepID=UPI000482DBEE|nr:alanine racemase [Marinobacterium jannaschii]
MTDLKDNPGTPLTIEFGQLYCEGCNTTELANRFGTPLFVLSEQHLRNNLREYQRTFEAHWPEGKVRIMPAIKANPTVAVRKILTEEGAGCDVFGPGELECALRGGVPPEMISVNGSIKDRDIIRKAASLGARIVLDSPKELEICNEVGEELNKTVRVMLRLKPYLHHLEEKSDFLPQQEIRELTQTIKYGIPTSELLPMGPRAIELPYVEPVGVHIHMGRHSKKLEVWAQLVESYVQLIKKLSELMGGWIPQEVDFGGGFAAPQDQETRVAVTDYPTPSLEDYARTVTTSFRTAMQQNGLVTDGITIEVEPGRGLHNETMLHLTRVHNIKQETTHIQHRWAEVDTSEVFLGITGVNPSPPFDYVVANKAEQPHNCQFDIVGITCNAEWLYQQVPVPELEEGDIIAMLNTGAYIEPMAANFNALPRPGMVLVNGDQADLIKRHETLDDVFVRHLVPERLK